jgi:hypothetical protein
MVLLGVTRSATIDDIRPAYKLLVKPRESLAVGMCREGHFYQRQFDELNRAAHQPSVVSGTSIGTQIALTKAA